MRSWFAGMITGVHDLFIFEGGNVVFLSTAQTARIENRTYIYVSQKGNFDFGTITVQRKAKAEFQHIITPMSITTALMNVKYQGELTMNNVIIHSDYGIIESQGIFNLDKVGHPSESGNGNGITLPNGIGLGAGHGGQGGGPIPLYGGKSFDSVYTPMEMGSGGGNGSGRGGRGGGYLKWDVAHKIEVNGLISLKGEDGQGIDSGGGSGGSILLKTTNMTGHGTIAVSGQGRGGGGAGGRLAIHCRWRYQFGGQFVDYGGDGGTDYETIRGAAAGTAYIEENLREVQYRHKKYDPKRNNTFLAVDHTYIHIDNIGKNVPPATIIMEPGLLDYEAPCSFIIDYGAKIIFPSEVHIHGSNVSIAGIVIGIHHIYIEENSYITFLSTAQTARIENGHYIDMTQLGNISFATVTVKMGGIANFLQILHPMQIDSSELKVKYKGVLLLNEAVIYSTYAWLESQSVFNLNGNGFSAELGTSAGKTFNKVGYGTAHGGEGGGSLVKFSSQPYGFIFSPNLVGSGGGNGEGVGGKGGGKLKWKVSHFIEVNGLLTSQGMKGSGLNSGSIVIQTTNITVHGEINVKGGDASGLGGGGAGGRIAIHCRWKYGFRGKFINHGGLGMGVNHHTLAGAAGSTYVENNKRKLQYRHKKS